MEGNFDVIIVGGSYAGLSAAMALGRSLRRVVIVDSGAPCNVQTPHSHNFITHDGVAPHVIAAQAKQQVLNYPTITFLKGVAVRGEKIDSLFRIDTNDGASFQSRKLLFATGLKDIMPAISGFSECWGISVLHCPYCHGYEVKNKKTGIIGNGNKGFELVRLISHWTRELVLFTNGPSELTDEQRTKIEAHKINVVETEIDTIEHEQGYVRHLSLKDGSSVPLSAIYARPAFIQHCPIPAALGCELNEQNLLKVDATQKTTVGGIYAAGDNSVPGRAVSLSVASGGLAGASLNKELIDETF